MKSVSNLGLYVHIPFCRHKCDYCDFYSLSGREDQMDAYTDVLIRHLGEVAPHAQRVDTVYFGGGTPSYLGAERLKKILKIIKKCYSLTPDAEITLECNPDSIGDKRTIRTLRRCGFNRISLGVQAMDDTLLQAVGRIHTVQQVYDAVENARKAGIKNISIDLIYGLPGQTMAQWKETLQKAVALDCQHISCYGLKIEEGTHLWKKQDTLTLPDDDVQADMYLYTVDYLDEYGYSQYEISNFARPDFESRHNLRYWQMQEYAGFGPGAHSDMGGVRFAYEKDLNTYISGDLRLSEEERINPMDRDMEYIMLSLRTAEGLDAGYYVRQFRQRFDDLEKLFVSYENAGLAKRTPKGWRLTPRGFFVSNSIIVSLQEAVAAAKIRRSEAAARGDFRVENLLQ